MTIHLLRHLLFENSEVVVGGNSKVVSFLIQNNHSCCDAVVGSIHVTLPSPHSVAGDKQYSDTYGSPEWSVRNTYTLVTHRATRHHTSTLYFCGSGGMCVPVGGCNRSWAQCLKS